jgi:hypothetical protein
MFGNQHKLWKTWDPDSSDYEELHVGFLLDLLFRPEYQAVLASETSVYFYQNIRRYVPEDSTFRKLWRSAL